MFPINLETADTTMTALAALSASDGDGLQISPVIHPRDGVPHPSSRTFWSASANALYIVRQPGADLFGPTPDFTDRLAQGNDLVACGRRGPIGCDADAVRGLALWDVADRAAAQDRPSAPVAYHLIGWLPTGASRERWREIALEFLDREIAGNGMVADWAVHALAGKEGGWIKKPHLHIVATHRFWRPGRRTGEPNPAWLGTAKWRQKAIDGWERLGSGPIDVRAAI